MSLEWEYYMDILYVTKHFPYGTSEAFLISELRELINQGHEVTIVPLRPGKQILHKDISDLSNLSVRQGIFSSEILTHFFGMLVRQPQRVWRGFKLVLKSHTLSVFLKNLLLFPKSIWLAKLIDEGSFDHVHAHWISTPASLAFIAAELTQTPWSITAHRSDIVLNNLLQAKTDSARFVRYIAKSSLTLAERSGLKDEKNFVLHLGVEFAELTEQSVTESACLRLLCPANLVEVKGHKYLIEAVHLLKQRGHKVLLQIAGKGKLEAELKTQVDELGLSEDIVFLGQLAHKDLLKLYATSQVDGVVLASLDLGDGVHEGIPVALIEAMSYALPVVATQTGGVPELVVDGTGLLVKDKDSAALADTIETLYDAEFRRQLGKTARLHVEEAFASKSIVRQLVAAIQTTNTQAAVS